jgi:hypothetical protein
MSGIIGNKLTTLLVSAVSEWTSQHQDIPKNQGKNFPKLTTFQDNLNKLDRKLIGLILRNTSTRANWLGIGFIVGISLLLTDAATATNFKLNTLTLDSGLILSGSVTTDGTQGALAAGNFTGWNIKITSFNDIATYNKTTSPFADVSLVSVTTDGKLTVATPPDEFSDGGVLSFRRGAFFLAQLADFTSAFLPGGQAGYIANRGNFSFLPLNQPNGIDYVVAEDSSPTTGGTIFNIRPLDLGDGLFLRGTITTDGTVGSLTGNNLLDWNLNVSESSTRTFTEKNSRVLAAEGVQSDENKITVTNPDGSLAFGLPGIPGRLDPTIVQLADFTDPTNNPGGQAFYLTPFGLEGTLTPLSFASDYVVARLASNSTVPEPSTTLGLVTLGLLGIGSAIKR